MKTTEERLKQIIAEELTKALNEADLGPDARGETDVTKAVSQMLMSDGFRKLRKQFNLIIPAVDASVVQDIAKHFKMR